MTLDAKGVRRLNDMLQKVRDEHGDVPIQMLITLLAAATHDGMSQNEVIRLTGQSKAAVSRNVRAWTLWTRHKERGPGYLELREDPYDARHKTIHLTPQGEKYLNALVA